MENNFEIFIMADPITAWKRLGYKECEYNEYGDSEMIEIEQGLSIYTVFIEEDGTFEIPEGYHGRIDSDEEFFELVKIDENYYDKEPISTIAPGRYKIENDTIRRIDEGDSTTISRIYY